MEEQVIRQEGGGTNSIADEQIQEQR
jgi:hypothetical protein